jgi:hypothetical protein
MLVKALLKIVRACSVVAVTAAASSLPIYGLANDVALRLTSVRWEKEKLRQKVAQSLPPGIRESVLALDRCRLVFCCAELGTIFGTTT